MRASVAAWNSQPPPTLSSKFRAPATNRMPSLPSFSDLTTRVDGWVKAFGADPITSLKNIDFKTVGLVGAGVLLAVLLIDLLGYLYAMYKGTSRNYVPYSRSFALMAADAWENRHDNAIGEYYDPYARTRALEPLTNVLDSLSAAVRRWGQEEEVHQPSFSAPHPSFSAPPYSFNAPPHSFNAPHPSFNAPHPSFGAPQFSGAPNAPNRFSNQYHSRQRADRPMVFSE